jgi:hypothetical protein
MSPWYARMLTHVTTHARRFAELMKRTTSGAASVQMVREACCSVVWRVCGRARDLAGMSLMYR